MELPVIMQSTFKVDPQGFICCTGKNYMNFFRPNHQKQAIKIFQAMLDGMGALSAKAQALKQVITSSLKFTGTDHRIYIKVKDNKALGFVKVGQKNLFYRDFVILQLFQIGSIKQLKPTCVLDIYVHQSCQRSGIGKEVFEKFLRSQGKTPEKLAYDRPSQKLLSFLKKHYGLVKFIPQNNNFVIYDRFFSKQSTNLMSGKNIKQSPVILHPQSLNQVKTNLSSSSQSRIRPKSYLTAQNAKIQEKIEQKQIQRQKIIQKQQKHQKRQFHQFQGPSNQNVNLNKTMKHKNTTSEGFPLSSQQMNSNLNTNTKASKNINPVISLNNTTNAPVSHNPNISVNIAVNTNSTNKQTQNPSFRTTSNTYGNYYKKKY